MDERSLGDQRVFQARMAVPRLKPDRVRRPRLVERLEAAASGALVFVSGPAGSGKTTLVADWLASSRRPCAWLSLEDGPCDADLFLSRLAAALDLAIGPSDGQPAAPSGGAGAREASILGLAARLEALEGGRGLVIVVDDFHRLCDIEGQAMALRLWRLLPPGVGLVVASRQGIPFAAGRLRAQGELVEIGAEGLRFSLAEGREFLSRALPLRLSEEDSAALVARTEGWIAGLRLASLALAESGDPGRAVATFGGTTRSVQDFLAEEVLSGLDAEDHALLGAACLLDEFEAPLLDAMLGAGDSAGRLLRLERECLFVLPLDGGRRSYRLHGLLRGAVAERLHTGRAGAEAALRLRASSWLEAKGQPAEALRQAVLAGDARRVSSLAEDHALALLDRGDLGGLREAFEAMGAAAMALSPWLLLASAWAAAYSGELGLARARAAGAAAADPGASALLAAPRPEVRAAGGGETNECAPRFGRVSSPVARGELEAEAEAAKAAASGAGPRTGKLAGRVEALRAYVLSLEAESRDAALLAARALALLPAEDLSCRCLAEATLARALHGTGADDEATSWYEKAMESARLAGARHVRCLAAAGLADLHLLRGRLDRARALCQEALAEAGEDCWPSLADACVTLALVAWERDETGAALEAARRGLELARRWGQADSIVNAHTTLALALSASGDPTGGLELLERASGLESISAWHRLCLEEAAASIELERGNRAGADAFCSRPQPVRTFEGAMTVSHWLILKRRGAEALPVLEVLVERGEARGAAPRQAEGLVLLAMAAKGRGDDEAARTSMARALALATPSGCVRRFSRRGEAAAAIVRELVDAGAPPFARAVLAAFETDLARRVGWREARRAEGGTAEALSPRELEVLRLLGSGLTAEEIGERAFVAASTVRSHIKAIYGKLGVHRRVEALRRAGEIGLL